MPLKRRKPVVVKRGSAAMRAGLAAKTRVKRGADGKLQGRTSIDPTKRLSDDERTQVTKALWRGEPLKRPVIVRLRDTENQFIPNSRIGKLSRDQLSAAFRKVVTVDGLIKAGPGSVRRSGLSTIYTVKSLTKGYTIMGFGSPLSTKTVDAWWGD